MAKIVYEGTAGGEWHLRGAPSHLSSDPWLSREEAAATRIQENLEVAWEQGYHFFFRLVFLFVFETRFHHVSLAVLQLTM